MSPTTTTSVPNDDIAAYVRAAARLQGLALSDAQNERVAVHLARTAALAATLQQLPLADHDEPAQIYEAAPFPLEDPHPSPLPQAGEGADVASRRPLAGQTGERGIPSPARGRGLG